MLVQCTKKMLDELKMKPEPVQEEETLYGWHANVMTVQRKKMVVLVHDMSRFPVILFGVKAKDFANLSTRLAEAISVTFRTEGIAEDVVAKFVEDAQIMTITKTRNRTTVARLNKICEDIPYFLDYLEPETMIQTTLSGRIGRMIYGNGKNAYIVPADELQKLLASETTGNVLQVKAYQLKVTLELSNYPVWRRLIVPANTNYYDFHRILQKAFNWQEFHLHDFYIIPGRQDGDKMVYDQDSAIRLVSDRRFLMEEDDVPKKMDEDVLLEAHMPAEIYYTYDFGDDWMHEIEVEDVIEDYSFSHATCIAGDGTTPPEDVGGEVGFDDFLKIIEDIDHPEYEEMVEWALGQGYASFDKDRVNRELRRIASLQDYFSVK